MISTNLLITFCYVTNIVVYIHPQYQPFLVLGQIRNWPIKANSTHLAPRGNSFSTTYISHISIHFNKMCRHCKPYIRHTWACQHTCILIFVHSAIQPSGAVVYISLSDTHHTVPTISACKHICIHTWFLSKSILLIKSSILASVTPITLSREHQSPDAAVHIDLSDTHHTTLNTSTCQDTCILILIPVTVHPPGVAIHIDLSDSTASPRIHQPVSTALYSHTHRSLSDIWSWIQRCVKTLVYPHLFLLQSILMIQQSISVSITLTTSSGLTELLHAPIYSYWSLLESGRPVKQSSISDLVTPTTQPWIYQPVNTHVYPHFFLLQSGLVVQTSTSASVTAPTPTWMLQLLRNCPHAPACRVL